MDIFLLISPRARCEPQVGHHQCSILSITYWCVKVDSGVGSCGCVSGGVNDVIPYCTTKRRTPKGIATNLCVHKKHHNTEMVYGPSQPEIDNAAFDRKDWTSSEFGHLQGIEELPPKMPGPCGIGLTMVAKVDADHAADTITRRSRMGYLVYLNSALVYWSSKKQTSVESTMKQCCEYIHGLRYKLRMMGFPVEEPAYIRGDNQSVLCNTSRPDSTLKKKSQSIAFHFVREGFARDVWKMAYVNTHYNQVDLLTKVLPHGEKQVKFVRNLLHHIFGTYETKE